MFLSYLKFLYHSKNQYSVHSPFVYQFLINGLYKKLDKTAYKSLKLGNIISRKDKILFKIIHYFQPKTILQIGKREATIVVQLASKSSKITTVEGFKNIENSTQDNFDSFQFKNFNLQNKTFNDFLNNSPENTFFDAIYIAYPATLDYFNQLINYICNDSFIILDGIHRNKEIKKTWYKIKNHEKVTVSIDLFYFGLIFFRKEQEKQHFILRS